MMKRNKRSKSKTKPNQSRNENQRGRKGSKILTSEEIAQMLERKDSQESEEIQAGIPESAQIFEQSELTGLVGNASQLSYCEDIQPRNVEEVLFDVGTESDDGNNSDKDDLSWCPNPGANSMYRKCSTKNVTAVSVSESENEDELAIALELADTKFYPESLLKKEIAELMEPSNWWTAVSSWPGISHELATFATELMSLPATTEGIERVFSVVSNILTKKRNRLGITKAFQLCVIYITAAMKNEQKFDLDEFE